MNRNYLTKKKLMLALFTCFLKFSFAITIPGSGTITNPYRISTINELKQFRDNINSSTYNNAYKSKYYELANDIEACDKWASVIRSPPSIEVALGATHERFFV